MNISGIDASGKVFEKSGLITKLTAQNRCCYDKISNIGKRHRTDAATTRSLI